ncbi:hypothetical protein J6O86_07570 [bacterium]|nr:hypothetical protein [bacterium]
MSLNINFNPELGNTSSKSIQKQTPKKEIGSIFSGAPTSTAAAPSSIKGDVLDLTQNVKVTQEYDKNGKLISTSHYHTGETEPFMKTSYDNGKVVKKEMFDPPITTEYFYEGDVLIREEEDWGENIVKDERTGSSADMGSDHITREYSVEQGYTGNESFMDKHPIKETLTTKDGKYKQITEYKDGKETTTVYRADEQGNWVLDEKASKLE